MQINDIHYLERMRVKLIDNCSKCHGTEPFCSCAYAFRNETHKVSANIPEAYRDFTLAKFVHPELTKEKKHFSSYLKTIGTSEQRDLLITGTRGVGKTSLAICALIKAIECGKRAYYFHSYKKAMEASFSLESAERTALENADLVVIDGIGSGFIRDVTNGTEALKAILLERAALGKHVIFVSSLPYQNLAGADKDLIKSINPRLLNLVGFDYKKEVLGDVPIDDVVNKPKKKRTKKDAVPAPEKVQEEQEYLTVDKEGKPL